MKKQFLTLLSTNACSQLYALTDGLQQQLHSKLLDAFRSHSPHFCKVKPPAEGNRAQQAGQVPRVQACSPMLFGGNDEMMDL